MVQIIGLMIGCYIISRMISFITRSGSIEENTTAKVIFGINIVVTIFLMLMLFAGGLTTPGNVN
ncbi:MAG: hypothetical protein V3V72_02455 [Ignavibacteriaceae bacterium]